MFDVSGGGLNTGVEMGQSYFIPDLDSNAGLSGTDNYGNVYGSDYDISLDNQYEILEENVGAEFTQSRQSSSEYSSAVGDFEIPADGIPIMSVDIIYDPIPFEDFDEFKQNAFEGNNHQAGNVVGYFSSQMENG